MEIKEKIIEHSRKLLIQKGYRSLRVDEIASDLGISKRTIYENFNSKDELVFSVVKETFDELYRKLEPAINKAINSKTNFVENFLSVIEVQVQHLKLFTGSFLEDVRKNMKNFEDKCEIYKNRNKELFYEFIQSGIENGYFRKDLKIEILFLTFISVIKNVVDYEMQKELKMTIDEIVLEVYQIVMTGFMTDKIRKKMITNFNK